MSQLPEWYLSHYLIKSYEVIGFALQPYSVHHFIHLSAVDSKLLRSYDPKVTIHDLETACLICSTRFGDDVVKTIDHYNKSKKTVDYRKVLCKATKDNPSYLALEFSKFKAYQSACETPPTVRSILGEDTESETPPTIPWTLTCTASCMREFGFTEADAMNMPIGKLIAFAYTAQYLKHGESPIIGEAEMLQIKLAKGEITLDDIKL